MKAVKIFLTIVKFFISIFLLLFVVNNLDINYLLDNILAVNILSIFVCTILFIFSSFLLSSRWNLFLKKYKSISNKNLFKIYWASDFINLFGLASIGGEAYKTLIFKSNKKKVLYSSLLSRAYSLIGLFIIAVSGYISYVFLDVLLYQIISLLVLLIFFTILFVLFNNSLLLLLKNVFKKKTFLMLLKEATFARGILLKSFLLNFIFVINVVFVYFIIFYFSGLPILFLETIIFVPVLSIALALPISIQGIGVREYLFLNFALYNNLALELVILASFLTYFVYVLYSLLGSYYFITLKKLD